MDRNKTNTDQGKIHFKVVNKGDKKEEKNVASVIVSDSGEVATTYGKGIMQTTYSLLSGGALCGEKRGSGAADGEGRPHCGQPHHASPGYEQADGPGGLPKRAFRPGRPVPGHHRGGTAQILPSAPGALQPGKFGNGKGIGL